MLFIAFCCSFRFLVRVSICRSLSLLLFVALSCFWNRINPISKTKTSKCLLLLVMAFCCSFWFFVDVTIWASHCSLWLFVGTKNQNKQEKVNIVQMETRFYTSKVWFWAILKIVQLGALKSWRMHHLTYMKTQNPARWQQLNSPDNTSKVYKIWTVSTITKKNWKYAIFLNQQSLPIS